MRFDRSTVVLIALTIALGNALWQVLASVGTVAASAIVEAIEGKVHLGTIYLAEFKIGGVTVIYGLVVSGVITLALALGTTVLVGRSFRQTLLTQESPKR